jgi:hypothetical protein
MFSLLIAVNADIADAAAGLGVPSAQIRVIPAYFPPDSDVRESSDSALAELRKRCGVLLFTSGFLHADWGILNVARSLSAIGDLKPGLVVAHSGATDEGYIGHVKSAVPDQERLLFYGELPHDQFLARLASADIYVRASLYDGDSLAVREALDLGKSVIASDCAPRPGGCTLFQTGSQDSLDQALRRVVAQPRSTSVCQPQSGSRELLEIYESLLNQWHASPEPARV